MTEFVKVGTWQMALLILGTIIMIVVPPIIAIMWVRKKNERFSTVFVGAITFLLFAIVLEKPTQNALVFPTYMGLPAHAMSEFISTRPLLLAFIIGLFPGVFEETGRFVAYKTVLRNRKNRETSISYGIGHGGFEVMFIVGVSYATYIVYAVMINSGTFGTIVDQVMSQAPDQVEPLVTVANQIAAFSARDFAVGVVERIFAVLFHIGASILVFYACKDRARIWLYLLAVLLHTLMDFIAGLTVAEVWNPPAWMLEGIVGVIGVLTFCGALILLYSKDVAER